MARTTIRTEDITASEVTTAKMATDPTNASNLASGTVGTARMGSGTASSSTVLYGDGSWKAEPVTDTTSLEDDIALLGFKVAANGSLAKYDLVDQAIDDFQDSSGIDASASTNEVRNSANYFIGGSVGTVTGGTITTHGIYKVHTFTSSSNFVTDVAGTADFLLVGGGGSSGGGHYNGGSGGGGGGGGVGALAPQPVSAASHAVTVGAGGTGAQYGDNGDDSSVVLGSTLTASGGGGGGFGTVDTSDSRDGLAGASGGGGGIGAQVKSGGAGNTPSTTPAQGYAGGDAATGGAGGGGGAGEVGNDAPGSGSLGGVGGDGVQNDWRTGSNVYYGGGGGGSGWSSSTYIAGGEGGGGRSGVSGDNVGTAGTANTGGGGGGSHGASGSHWPGASGGSGIVVVRYVADSGFLSPTDLTLVSNATTAEDGAPTKGDMVMTYTNGAGTATLNTDLKGYVSRDNGSNWTQGTLVSQGTTGGHIVVTFHDLDISGQPSGTSMRYKITTHNQSGAKETRIQAVSLGWS